MYKERCDLICISGRSSFWKPCGEQIEVGVEKAETGKSRKKDPTTTWHKMRTNGNLASGGVGGMKKQIQEMFYWHFFFFFYYKDKTSFLLVPGIPGIPALWYAGS